MSVTVDVGVAASTGTVDPLTADLELVYLPRLGPTATLLWRMLVARGDFTWSTSLLARNLGVPTRKVDAALGRLATFNVAHVAGGPDHVRVVVAARGASRPAGNFAQVPA